MLAYLVVLGGSLCLSLALTPLSIRLSKRLGILARPGGRRQHRGLVPKLGGLVVLGAFLGGALLSLAVRGCCRLRPKAPIRTRWGALWPCWPAPA